LREEIRYTLVGGAIGIIAAISVVLECALNKDGGELLSYICPLTSHLLRWFAPPIIPLIFLALIVGAFFEWLLWGVLIDLCRMLGRMNP